MSTYADRRAAQDAEPAIHMERVEGTLNTYRWCDWTATLAPAAGGYMLIHRSVYHGTFPSVPAVRRYIETVLEEVDL